MPDESPSQGNSSSNPFGVTMRIVLPTEAADHPKSSVGTRVTAPAAPGRTPSVRATAVPQSGADFLQLLHNLYDAAFITDMAGDILMSNPRADHAFQVEPGQLDGVNLLTLVCGADDTLLGSIRETLQTNRFVLMQAHCIRGDGSFFPTEISMNPLRLDGRDRISFFIRDVTLRNEQEEKLRSGHSAMENASSGIAIADLDCRIEFCNPAFASFFGFPDAAAATGLDLRELICAPGRLDEILAETATGKTWEGEFELERAGDELFHAHASIVANLDADGNPAGIVVSVLDTTTQERAQQQREEFAAQLRLRNAQMQEELDLAGELQVALMPAQFQGVPGTADAERRVLEFRHVYCPSGRIGGDFFHIRELSNFEASVFIVDVMGHGVRSALVVATIRGLLEELRPLARDPGALLTQLNKNFTAIFRRMGVDMTFATALYAVMDARSGRFRYANASHPSPYVLRSAEATVESLADAQARSTALGILEDASYTNLEIDLEPGDQLVLFTDGLAEAQSPSGEFFMDGKMDALLRENVGQSSQIVLDALLGGARSFSELETMEDDVCLVAMQVMRRAGGGAGKEADRRESGC